MKSKKILLFILTLNSFNLNAEFSFKKAAAWLAGSVVVVGGGFYAYKKVKRENIKSQLDQGSRACQKINSKFSKELSLAKEHQLTKDKLTVVADKIPLEFSKYLQEIGSSISECEKYIALSSDVKSAYKKDDEICLLSNDLCESLQFVLSQLEQYYSYLNKYKSYFVLKNGVAKFSEVYKKELESISLELSGEVLNEIILQKCCDVSSVYPYVAYMERIISNAKEFEQILSDFAQISDNKDFQITKVAKEAANIKKMFDDIKKNISLSVEYQKQRKQYQEAQRAQVLMEVEQKKLQSEKEKNLIEFGKLEELKKANLLKEQEVREQLNNKELLQAIYNQMTDLARIVNTEDGKVKLENISRQLKIVKERVSRPII